MSTQMTEVEAVRKAMMEGKYTVALRITPMAYCYSEYKVTMYSFSDTDNQTVVVNDFQTVNGDKLKKELDNASKPIDAKPVVGVAMFRHEERPRIEDIFSQ